MRPLIITSGEKYNDIDALSCATAYKNLLGLKGLASRVVFTGPLNKSVTETIKSWGFDVEKDLNGNPKGYNYVMVDISDPAQFTKFVVNEKVVEVFDHRQGFEAYWREKLGDRSHIEMVGACATLIWEEFKKAGLENRIDETNANLLYTAIISNTLNMQSQITSDRDRAALRELSSHTKLPNDWYAQYFNEVSRSIMLDPLESMAYDTKTLKINGTPYTIIQLELWDGRKFIDTHYGTITRVINDSNVANTFLTCPSISEGFNYLVATNHKLKEELAQKLNAEFYEHLGKTKNLWLRKEIIRVI